MACHLLITAEHATNRVPPRYRSLFAGRQEVLESHRGYDPGTGPLARRFARQCGAPLIAGTVTRLLVELNRSLRHPRLFSEFTSGLPRETKEELLRRYYHPHRSRVRSLIVEAAARGDLLVHVSVHSFTPELDGTARRADVGLLYDPARRMERALCDAWRAELRLLRPELIVRRNYPYLGKSDGLTTALRREFGPRRYAGIELEVNQAWPLSRLPLWSGLQQSMVLSFQTALKRMRLITR